MEYNLNKDNMPKEDETLHSVTPHGANVGSAYTPGGGETEAAAATETAGADTQAQGAAQPHQPYHTPYGAGTQGGYAQSAHSAWNYSAGYQAPHAHAQNTYAQTAQAPYSASQQNTGPRYEARYVPQHEVSYGPGTGDSKKEPKKRRGAGKAITAIALVVACAAAGFGGGFAAINTYGGGQTVVYKTPEGDTSTSNPSGINTSDGMTVSQIAEKAGPSVVSIVTENMVADYFTGGRIESGAGSGVIIGEDGTILTNNHVITGAQNITVTLADGTEYPATVVGSDPNTDIAVIKINATGLTPATIGDADAISVGDFCLAIGNPMGTLGGTVTDGIVSALDRQITIDNYTMNLLQMSAAVSPGNSGGGLFNDRGELIGIVNAKSSGEGAEGLGFAIPVDTAMDIAETIIGQGYVSRPGLGVVMDIVSTQEQADQAGYTQPGLYINEVQAGGAAQAAGLQAGDRIVEAGGVSVSSMDDLREILYSKDVGDTLDLTVERGGTTLGFTVTLQEVSN